MALMTRLATVGNGAGCCLGRQASRLGGASSAMCALASPNSISSSLAPRKVSHGAVTLSRPRVMVGVRAASTTTADETSTAAPAAAIPFKRHERIAAIKVRDKT